MHKKLKVKPNTVAQIHPLAKEKALAVYEGPTDPKDLLVAVSDLMIQGVSWEDAGAVVIMCSKHPEFIMARLIKAAREHRNLPGASHYLMESKRLLLPEPGRSKEDRLSARLQLYRAEVKGSALAIEAGFLTEDQAIDSAQIGSYATEIEGLLGRPMAADECLHEEA